MLDGVHYDFDADPGWEGMDNRATFKDRAIRPYHDFGFSRDTAHAGGEPGEIGGVVWRSEEDHPEQAGY